MVVLLLLIKRFIDVAFSTILLVVLMPLMAVIAICIGAGMGRPILFRQERAGFRGRPFTIIKFRTMTNDKDNDGQLLPKEQRVTRLGRFLRASSLDELPELLNVLRGEMSLVGPRPLHVYYLPRYDKDQLRRHEMRPGITGWAQVNGRNALSWEERLSLDVWYVKHWSLLLDAKTLLRTITTVFGRDGITHSREQIMPEFTGSVRITPSSQSKVD